MRRATGTRRLACALLLAAGSAAAEDPSDPTRADAAEPSLSEINKKLTNPVSDLWSITFQQNNYRVDLGPGIGERWNSNLNFQPVLPIAAHSPALGRVRS